VHEIEVANARAAEEKARAETFAANARVRASTETMMELQREVQQMKIEQEESSRLV